MSSFCGNGFRLSCSTPASPCMWRRCRATIATISPSLATKHWLMPCARQSNWILASNHVFPQLRASFRAERHENFHCSPAAAGFVGRGGFYKGRFLLARIFLSSHMARPQAAVVAAHPLPCGDCSGFCSLRPAVTFGHLRAHCGAGNERRRRAMARRGFIEEGPFIGKDVQEAELKYFDLQHGERASVDAA